MALPYYIRTGNFEATEKNTGTALANQKEPSFLLAVDVLEGKDKVELWVSLPGVEKTDFNIELENGSLRIKAERKNPIANSELTFRQQEMRYGVFERRFKLGKELDTDNITATYQKGILKISIPKIEVVSKMISVA
jgi:HSP20 family protein